jgi:uncharacterized protein YxjI
MRYVMKQHFVSFGDDFTIKDESGQERFFADGHAFSIGDALTFKDMQGNVLAEVRQKLLSIGKTFDIYRGGTRVATVKKRIFTLFRDAFDVVDETQGDFDAEGNFFDLDYRITRDGRVVATISKKLLSLRDSYTIDVAEGEDDVLILCIATVIDMCSHDGD